MENWIRSLPACTMPESKQRNVKKKKKKSQGVTCAMKTI